MSDIRFNQWLHQSGTGGVSQVDGGHVGIGTTNPDIAVHSANAKKLNVGIVTANSIYAGNYYGNGSNLTGIGDADKIIEGDTKVEVVDSGDQYISAEVNGSESLRIDSSGSLLIGGTSSSGATEKLRIENDSATSDVCQVTIISGNAERAVLNFGDAQDHNIGRVTYNNSDNHMSLWTDNTERLRITSDGKVKIGNSGGTPDGKLHIDEIGTGDIVAELTSGSPMFTYRNGTNAWFHAGKHPSDDAFVVTTGGTTTASEKFRINSAGNVGINESNPTDKLHVNGTTNFVSNSYIGGDLYMYGNSYGNGVFLGGSNAVHKLDYYKKGTWTPAMWRNGHGSEITLGSGNRYGHYIRVGDLLHISFYWYNPSLSSSSGSYWIVRDLPFNLLTSSGGAYQFIPGGYFYQQGDSNGDASQYGTYRWQANGSLSANTLTLYANNNSRNANGATEFSGTGTLIVA